MKRKKASEWYAWQDATRAHAGNRRNPGIGQHFVRSLNGCIEFDKAKTHFALRVFFVPLETTINLPVALQFRSNACRILTIVLSFLAGCKTKQNNTHTT